MSKVSGRACPDRTGSRPAAPDGAEKEMAIRVRLGEEAAFTVRLGFETASGSALTDWSVAE